MVFNPFFACLLLLTLSLPPLPLFLSLLSHPPSLCAVLFCLPHCPTLFFFFFFAGPFPLCPHPPAPSPGLCSGWLLPPCGRLQELQRAEILEEDNGMPVIQIMASNTANLQCGAGGVRDPEATSSTRRGPILSPYYSLVGSGWPLRWCCVKP